MKVANQLTLRWEIILDKADEPNVITNFLNMNKGN